MVISNKCKWLLVFLFVLFCYCSFDKSMINFRCELSDQDSSTRFFNQDGSNNLYLVKTDDNSLEFKDSTFYRDIQNQKLKEIGQLKVESIFYLAAEDSKS